MTSLDDIATELMQEQTREQNDTFFASIPLEDLEYLLTHEVALRNRLLNAEPTARNHETAAGLLSIRPTSGNAPRAYGSVYRECLIDRFRELMRGAA